MYDFLCGFQVIRQAEYNCRCSSPYMTVCSWKLMELLTGCHACFVQFLCLTVNSTWLTTELVTGCAWLDYMRQTYRNWMKIETCVPRLYIQMKLPYQTMCDCLFYNWILSLVVLLSFVCFMKYSWALRILEEQLLYILYIDYFYLFAPPVLLFDGSLL